MSQHWSFGWDEIAAFANAGAVVVAALVGGWGVKRWRTERVETRQAELAEEALALMYRAPEVFNYIRNPGSFHKEGETRHREERESDEEARARDLDFMPFERINNHRKYFERVIDIRPSIKAIFGKDKAVPLDKVLEIRSDISRAAWMITMLKRRGPFGTDEQLEKHLDQIEEHQNVIWNTYGESDQINTELQEAVAEMEETAAPILRSRLQIGKK